MHESTQPPAVSDGPVHDDLTHAMHLRLRDRLAGSPMTVSLKCDRDVCGITFDAAGEPWIGGMVNWSRETRFNFFTMTDRDAACVERAIAAFFSELSHP